MRHTAVYYSILQLVGILATIAENQVTLLKLLFNE